MPIKEKIETIAKEIYGADGVEFSEEAEKKIVQYTEQVFFDFEFDFEFDFDFEYEFDFDLV